MGAQKNDRESRWSGTFAASSGHPRSHPSSSNCLNHPTLIYPFLRHRTTDFMIQQRDIEGSVLTIRS
jgi:hypothetical protein